MFANAMTLEFIVTVFTLQQRLLSLCHRDQEAQQQAMKLKFIFSEYTEGGISIRNAKAFSLKGTKDSIPGLTPTQKILFTKTKP